MRLPTLALAMLLAGGAVPAVFAQASASSATSQRMAVPSALHNDADALPASAGMDDNRHAAAAGTAAPAGTTGVTRRVREANKHSLDATGHKVDAAGNPVGQAAETDDESQ